LSSCYIEWGRSNEPFRGRAYLILLGNRIFEVEIVRGFEVRIAQECKM
jgi:hypothetical protein